MRRLFLSILVLIFSLPAEGSRVLRLALIQTPPPGTGVTASLDRIEKEVLRCRRADLVVLPELFATGCRMKPDGVGLSRSEAALHYDTIRTRMSRWSVRTGASIVGSAVCEEEGLHYNRLIVARPDGTFVCYDKHNVFKRGGFTPGRKRLRFDCHGVRIVPLICYDLRFDEWSRRTPCFDYDLLLYIAAWPASRGDEWDRLLRERARENDIPVVGVNFCGKDADGLSFAGASQVLMPDGRIRYRAGRRSVTKIVRLKIGASGDAADRAPAKK